jgi:hypothetical protein
MVVSAGNSACTSLFSLFIARSVAILSFPFHFYNGVHNMKVLICAVRSTSAVTQHPYLRWGNVAACFGLIRMYHYANWRGIDHVSDVELVHPVFYKK